jgi:hypothetical protein
MLLVYAWYKYTQWYVMHRNPTMQDMLRSLAYLRDWTRFNPRYDGKWMVIEECPTVTHVIPCNDVRGHYFTQCYCNPTLLTNEGGGIVYNHHAHDYHSIKNSYVAEFNTVEDWVEYLTGELQ